jgi:hypothetical protein
VFGDRLLDSSAGDQVRSSDLFSDSWSLTAQEDESAVEMFLFTAKIY